MDLPIRVTFDSSPLYSIQLARQQSEKLWLWTQWPAQPTARCVRGRRRWPSDCSQYTQCLQMYKIGRCGGWRLGVTCLFYGNAYREIKSLRDCSLPSRCRRDVRASGILRSVDWQFRTDVSVQSTLRNIPEERRSNKNLDLKLFLMYFFK